MCDGKTVALKLAHVWFSLNNAAPSWSLILVPEPPPGLAQGSPGPSSGPEPRKSPKRVSADRKLKGPAERGHVKKRQKSSKSVKNIFDTFRHFSRRAKNVKNRQKVSKIFSTIFARHRFSGPFWGPLGVRKVALPPKNISLHKDSRISKSSFFYPKVYKP